MAVIIGTDEAGYGPNLGPLVIAATVWDTAATLPAGPSPWTMPPVPVAAASGPRLRFGDSKRLFTSGGSLAAIERGVWGALGAIDAAFLHGGTWRGLVDRLDPGRLAQLDHVPWYAGHNRPVPTALSPAAIGESVEQCVVECGRAAIRLRSLHARIVCAPEFNIAVARHGNKATALSRWTLELVSTVLAQIDDHQVGIWSDKHGGRNRYAALLQHHLTAARVQVRGETRAESNYAWREGERQVEVHFLARGEQLLPVALASMVAKYLRELAMGAFNDYWLARVPNLRPTAGYPVDARRFVAAIRDAQRRLGIAETMLWRTR